MRVPVVAETKTAKAVSPNADARDARNVRALVSAVVVVMGLGLVVWALRADDVWFQVHTMSCHCVVEEGSLPKAHAARWGAALLGVVLIVFVRPRLVRRFAGRSLGSLLGSSFRIAAAVVLALVVTEVVLRARGVRPPPESPRRDVDLPASAEKDHMIAGRTVHYATNSHGFRARTPNEVPDLTAPTIIFIGESIAFGYGLDYDETIPALVGKHTGIQTVNLAVSGSGTDETLVRLRARLPQFSRPIAVVSFVVYNWLDRNVAGDRSRLALRGGVLEELGPLSPSLRSSPLRAILRTLIPYHDDEAVVLTRALMREIADVARARGASPLFVLTPRGTRCLTSDPGGPWIAKRLVESQPFPSIDVDIDDSLALGKDIHPGPRGAEEYAARIEAALRRGAVIQ
jgi:hypothetical protein